MSPFRRRSTWVVIALGLALSGSALWSTRSRAVTTVPSSRKDLEHRIVATGRVLAPARIQVSSLAAGLVVSVGPSLGQHVDVGDLLVQLDDSEARAALSQARASVEQARARVSQVSGVGKELANQSLLQAQSQLDKAQADFNRTQQLAASGAVPPTELENVRRALDVARAQRAAAAAQFAGTTGSDARLASGGLLQAEAQRAGAEVRLSQLRLLATSAGTVLARAVEPGDVVTPGKTLLTLAADGDMQLSFQADERNLSAIALGQRARASADAFPATEFDAEVAYIAPSIDPQRGTVEVRLKVPKRPAFLRADMTVSVDLLVATHPRALVVPSEAVRGATSPSPHVWMVEGGRLKKQAVDVGIVGEGAVEILSGVSEGAELALPEGKPFSEGQKVRATRKAP
ncbi:MAG: efflux RND transporter periplasmic adaptor subunit [Polyangiaceae bacterium]